MQQPSSHGQSPRYQLFPRDRKPPVSSNYRLVALDKLPYINMNTKEDKPSSTSAGLKAKIQQHSLVRRRKVSVPELGPMTTVQEVPMDSRMYQVLYAVANIYSPILQQRYQDDRRFMNALSAHQGMILGSILQGVQPHFWMKRNSTHLMLPLRIPLRCLAEILKYLSRQSSLLP